MAQAQYDEFVRLRKTWTDALTARKQAYWETPVASVATVTPTVPTTPAPVSTPQVPTSSEVIQWVKDLWWDVQNRQNTRNVMTWKGGTVTPSGAILNADWSVTPEHVETSSAPVTPAPTPTTPVETPAPIDKNAEIKAKNEAQMALNKQKSELAIADRKRQAEEVKLASIPTDQKWVLNALISWASVPTQNTQAYRNAKVQYDTFKKFNSMTPTQLLDNLKMNEIGTDMDQLLASNPNYVQAKQKLNEIQKVTNLNKTMSNIVAGANGTEIKAVTPEQNEIDISTKLMQKFGLDDANAEAFSQFIATDEEMADNKAKLLANRNQLSNVNRQINETTTLLNQGIKDIKAQYPDMSASGIITLMGSRLSEFNDTITNLNSTKSLLDADIKMEMDLAKSAFDAKSADIQAQNQIRSAMAIGDYNASIDLQKSQAEFEQKIAQQAQAMNDPVMAISSMIDEYKKLGIPFTRSTQQVIADFQSSGQDLPTYLSNLQKTIQSKPEYQQALAKKANEWVSFQTIGDKVYKVQNGQLIDTGIATAKTPDWKQDTSGNWYNANSTTSPAVQTSTLSPASISQISTRLQGNNVQCGMVSNDYAAVKFPDAPRMWDTYESKINTINAIWKAPIPQVWGLFVMDTWTSTGHTGIVTAVNGDGTFTATDANRSGSKDGWPLQTSTYKISDKISFSNAPVWTQVPQGFTDSDIAVLGSVAKLDKQGKQTLNENWLTERDWANFNAWLLPPTAKQKQESQVVVDRVDDILKWDWTDAVWPFLWKSRVFTWGGTDRKVTELKVAALKDLLAMANLDKIKWAMSDKDIEFLRNTATYLSTDLSESEFEKTLNEIKTKYSNIAWGKPTTWTTQTNTGAWQTDSLKIR